MSILRRNRTAVLLAFLLQGPVLKAQETDFRPLFNWDLVSLEQNNPRFNGSVLSGFHSVRSPGVTPYQWFKTGMGILYTREEQVSEATGSTRFTYNQVVVNPKLNYGFWRDFEAGLGVTSTYVTGKELVPDEVGTREIDEENVDLNSVDLGVKWGFLETFFPKIQRYHFSLSFDTRLAVNRGDFGMLPANFFNIEVDADFAVTTRFSLVGNLQMLVSDGAALRNQVMADIATLYSFTDQFRGMLFGTIKEDDEARTALGFVGIAGQYVFEQHSFTLAFDLLLNDADREFRSEEQLDIEFSYTFTF
jgi:hypothetical protein